MAKDTEFMTTKAASDEERMRFLKIDMRARQTLKEFQPHLEKNIRAVLDAFYDHVSGVPELRALLGSDGNIEGNIERLKGAQGKHWLHLFEGSFDDQHREQARRIGETHFRIDLKPTWYMGGYCFVLGQLHALAVKTYRRKPEKLAEVLAAINKAVFLDMDMALGVYHEAINREREKRQKVLEDLIAGFDTDSTEATTAFGSAAEQLRQTAQAMTATAEETSRQSSSVAAAAQQASANVQTVATAAEELTASIQEIGRQALQSANIAVKAVDEAEKTNHVVQGLAEAASKIGEVVNLINNIAGQTNLLALNATIEAARAGEAGKGFAVVAQEVKNLANQTAKATEDIAKQINSVQQETNDAVDAITQIGNVITEISDIATTIASAVEQQNASTLEIARNVQQAAKGTDEVSSTIESVNKAAQDTGASAAQLYQAAETVAVRSDQLGNRIEGFLKDVRTA